MKLKLYLRGIVSYTLSVALCLSTISVRFAHASPATTTEFIQQSEREDIQDKLSVLLRRKDVAQTLESYGVTADEARTRAASLTDEEASQVALLLDQLPAGSHHGLGTVVGAALVVFIVLLVTDILGLTKVFPFTRSVR